VPYKICKDCGFMQVLWLNVRCRGVKAVKAVAGLVTAMTQLEIPD